MDVKDYKKEKEDDDEPFDQKMTRLTTELGQMFEQSHKLEEEIKKNGVLDTGDFANLAERRWYFRSLGYGHDMKDWKDMMSALRLSGYDGTISIEHEDSLMSNNEGLCKAIDFLKETLIFEDKCQMYWA